MHGNLHPSPRGRSNRRRPTSGPKNIPIPPIAFGDLARFAFPVKTIEALGAVTGAGRTTIKTWLNGSHQPPFSVLAIVMGEIMRRLARQ